MPKVVTQQRRGRASNPRLLDRKSDALPLSHRAGVCWWLLWCRPVPDKFAFQADGAPIIKRTDKHHHENHRDKVKMKDSSCDLIDNVAAILLHRRPNSCVKQFFDHCNYVVITCQPAVSTNIAINGRQHKGAMSRKPVFSGENRKDINAVCPITWTYDIRAADTGTYYNYY